MSIAGSAAQPQMIIRRSARIAAPIASLCAGYRGQIIDLAAGRRRDIHAAERSPRSPPRHRNGVRTGSCAVKGLDLLPHSRDLRPVRGVRRQADRSSRRCPVWGLRPVPLRGRTSRHLVLVIDAPDRPEPWIAIQRRRPAARETCLAYRPGCLPLHPARWLRGSTSASSSVSTRRSVRNRQARRSGGLDLHLRSSRRSASGRSADTRRDF